MDELIDNTNDLTYDFGNLSQELTHIESRLKACTTNEERAMCHLYISNIGNTLAQVSTQRYQATVAKCLVTLEPRVLS